MADFTKKSKHGEDDESDLRQREELQVREKMRIECLADDEELIGDDMFSRMHEDLATNTDPGSTARGLPPARTTPPTTIPDASVTPVAALELEVAAPEHPAQELVLDVLAPEMRSGIDRRHVYGERGNESLRSPSDVAKLEVDIQHATSRDEVAHLSLRLARRFARVSALLVVNRGIINGLAAEGADLAERIEGVMISASMAGIFGDVCKTGQMMRAETPFEGLNVKVIGALGRRDVRDVVVIPVSIRGRVVGLLYADNGNDPVPHTSIGALRSLGEVIGSALGRLIMDSKR